MKARKPAHGTPARFAQGCACRECIAAHSREMAARKGERRLEAMLAAASKPALVSIHNVGDRWI